MVKVDVVIMMGGILDEQNGLHWGAWWIPLAYYKHLEKERFLKIKTKNSESVAKNKIGAVHDLVSKRFELENEIDSIDIKIRSAVPLHVLRATSEDGESLFFNRIVDTANDWILVSFRGISGKIKVASYNNDWEMTSAGFSNV